MIFTPTSFFDLNNFDHRAIFDGVNHVWEVLPRIEGYIQELFTSGRLKANYQNAENIYIGEGTRIEDGAKIVGPAIIGADCFIGHAAFIRGGCILGNGVTIGHATELKHVIMMNQAAAAHLNYIGDSIVGNDVNISGGAIVANLRLDHKEVTIRTSEGRIGTGLVKFGAIVGDNSNIGVNAVLNPGTLLGSSVHVYPLCDVRGFHPQNEIIR